MIPLKDRQASIVHFNGAHPDQAPNTSHHTVQTAVQQVLSWESESYFVRSDDGYSWYRVIPRFDPDSQEWKSYRNRIIVRDSDSKTITHTRFDYWAAALRNPVRAGSYVRPTRGIPGDGLLGFEGYEESHLIEIDKGERCYVTSLWLDEGVIVALSIQTDDGFRFDVHPNWIHLFKPEET